MSKYIFYLYTGDTFNRLGQDAYDAFMNSKNVNWNTCDGNRRILIIHEKDVILKIGDPIVVDTFSDKFFNDLKYLIR